MEKLNLKYNATKVDEIEKTKGNLPLENCIADTTLNNIALFIQKGLIDDNGIHGVSRTVAMSVIEDYLKEKDKEDLIFDITEALVDGGFLSRQLDVAKLRSAKTKKMAEVQDKLESL